MSKPRVKTAYIMVRFSREIADRLRAELPGIPQAATAIHHACCEFLRLRGQPPAAAGAPEEQRTGTNG